MFSSKRRTFSTPKISLTGLQKFAWLRFWLGLGFFTLCLSFCTPYPERLLKWISGDEFETHEEQTERPIRESSDDTDITESREQDTPIDKTKIEDEAESNRKPTDDQDKGSGPESNSEDQPEPTPVEPAPIVNPNATPNAYAIPITPPSLNLNFPSLPHIIPDGPSTDSIWDINELTRGLNLKTKINYIPGNLASEERTKNENYRATLTLDIVLPTPLKTAQELKSVNPYLPRIFPQLPKLMENAKVSGFYNKLMAQKQLDLRKKLTSFNKLLTRHNFYDCETILEIIVPETKRKVLWIQSEMDVVSDGSDGDRLPKMPDSIVNSAHYQPFTSYRWKKETTQENPLLPVWEKRLATAKRGPSTASNRESIAYMQRALTDFKNNSFLIAQYDPFIVIPLGILNNKQSDFAPSPGDYAVVVYQNKLYPAIVGDAGPSYKIGEASLRIAREINPKASPYARPVSDLKISYIVFPNSADPVKKAPDYAAWKLKCEELLTDMGGIAQPYTLHEWVDLLPKKTTLTPEPTTETDTDPTPDGTPQKPGTRPGVLPATGTGTLPSRLPSGSDKTLPKENPPRTPSRSTMTPRPGTTRSR